jgi:hypothetical protein
MTVSRKEEKFISFLLFKVPWKKVNKYSADRLGLRIQIGVMLDWWWWEGGGGEGEV